MKINSSVADLRSIAHQLTRYGLAGILLNGLGYLLYLALASAFGSPKLAVTVGYPIGVMFGYLMHGRFSFDYSGTHVAGLARYAVTQIAGFSLNLTVLWVGVDILGVRHQLVQLAAILIVAIQLFLMLKFWVYDRPIES